MQEHRELDVGVGVGVAAERSHKHAVKAGFLLCGHRGKSYT